MLSLWKLQSASAKSIIFFGCHYFSTHHYDSDNPYTVLGVKTTDSDLQIKAAYHTLSKKYHPDLNKDPRAVEILKKINHAYDQIKHSSPRASSQSHRHRTYHKQSRKQDDKGWDSTNYEDTNWNEEFRKQYQRDQRERSSEREDERTWHQEETKSSQSEKSDSKQDSKAESYSSREKGTDEYAHMTDEDIYFRIFQKTYKEDPIFYYRPENQHLRKQYEKILEKRGSRQRKYEDAYQRDKYWKRFKEEDFKGQMHDRDERPNEDSGVVLVLPAIGFAIAAFALYYMILRQSNTTILDPTKPGIEIEKARQLALKADEEKKRRVKDEYIGHMALMKKYPRTNPDAVTMLIDYTIWNDVKLYSIPYNYYYQKVDKSLTRKQFSTSPIHNLRLNTKLNLALETERALKHVFVPVSGVLNELKENGYYDPPVVCMRFWGFIMIKIRRKPIIAENLKESIARKEEYISLFDLFWRYTTPILLANYDDYVFRIHSTRFIPDTTTREGMAWLGFVTLNHRALPRKLISENDKNVFIWQGKASPDQSENDYIGYWSNFYETMKTLQH